VDERYTSFPRPVLWLIPEGSVEVEGKEVEVAPFYLSTLPVTNRQLEAFDRRLARSALAPGDDDPALGVGFEEARAYCAWYARVARKAIRLPRWSEWKRALGGDVARWGRGGATEHVWHRGNSGERVPRLDGKRSNELGLYGLVGGVCEWVEEQEEGLLCGGSWRMPLEQLVGGVWRRPTPGERPADAGFRIARSLRS
jgi:formylglycine-generating enzyme required for sulfatase activity